MQKKAFSSHSLVAVCCWGWLLKPQKGRLQAILLFSEDFSFHIMYIVSIQQQQCFSSFRNFSLETINGI